MKNKKLKSFICFLLCFVLLFSFPLNTRAHALAVESYLIYAIITGLAAMGFTFTVAGGVDAMIQAMEEKVDDYQKQGEIIDFYEVMRRNIKMVSSPSGGTDPEGNDLFNLLYNATAWDALEKFVDWLTSDGGWNLNSDISLSENTSTFSANYNAEEQVFVTTSGIVPNPQYGDYYVYDYSELGSYISVVRSDLTSGIAYLNSELFNYIANYSGYESGKTAYLYGLSRFDNSANDDLTIYFYYGNSSVSNANRSAVLSNVLGYNKPYLNSIKGVTFGYDKNSKFSAFLLTTDNYLVWLDSIPVPNDIVTLNTQVDIMTPEELEKQFPEVNQGVIMQQLEIGSPEIQEWARQVEELFIETGTIPQPQPEVITDPDYAPQPTPVPTPVPSPEIEDIEDLGLPALGEAIFNKFPFSLPKDIARVFDILTADPVTPYWEVDLTNDAIGISSKFVIDLEPYETVGQICRWVSVISFSLFLIIITKGMIGW